MIEELYDPGSSINQCEWCGHKEKIRLVYIFHLVDCIEKPDCLECIQTKIDILNEKIDKTNRKLVTTLLNEQTPENTENQKKLVEKITKLNEDTKRLETVYEEALKHPKEYDMFDIKQVAKKEFIKRRGIRQFSEKMLDEMIRKAFSRKKKYF